MTKRITLLLMLTLLLGGCVGGFNPIRLQQEDAPRLWGKLDLLNKEFNPTFFKGSRRNVIVELVRRGEVRPEFESDVIAQRIQIGMSIAELRASWGWYTSHHKSVGSWGVHIQYVYGRFPSATYVYAENGFVTSWQN